MKTNITSLAKLAGITTAIAMLTVAASTLSAQEKGGTRLTQLNASKAVPVTSSAEPRGMSCANCKDSFVVLPEIDAKGAGGRTLVADVAPTRIVAKHLCGSCSNEWVVKGHGKAKISVLIHKCTSCS